MSKFSLQHVLDKNKEYLNLLNKNRLHDAMPHQYFLAGEDDNQHLVIDLGYVLGAQRMRCGLYNCGTIKGSIQYLNDMNRRA